MADVWKTDLSDETWDIRPEEVKNLEITHEACRLDKYRWQNHFGDIFKEGDEITIKKCHEDFKNQSPTYTDEMEELYAEKSCKIQRILQSAEVYLEGCRFTWHLDWLSPPPPPLEDELFEL